MTLRRRMTLTVGVTVGGAILLAAAVAYLAVRSELRGQVDDRLSEQAALITERASLLDSPVGFELPQLPPEEVGPPIGFRVIGGAGEVEIDRGGVDVPVPSAEDVPDELTLTDAENGSEHIRVATAPIPSGGAIQLFRSLESVDEALASLRTVLFLVVMTGAALGALAARLIANRMLDPVASLTDAAEHVSETEDLSRRIDVTGDDEVSRLALRFNSMLERLEASRAELDESHEEQRRLIADASHELRTPVTSLRTNIELIAGGRLPDGEVAGALEDAVAQTEELGGLIGDLMDLARGEAPELATEDVRLDEVAAEAVERARRHAPGVSFALTAEPCVVEGAPDRLARALNNLLDNAAEHADGAPVEVSVTGGRVTVRDHGSGIDPAEPERLFDRFYRGSEARRRPGSGLGLAIVRQVAEAHGGSVTAANAAGGGAVFSLQVPEKPH
jgi:two-component system, OmpR family, sensor histidine kinase MprB